MTINIGAGIASIHLGDGPQGMRFQAQAGDHFGLTRQRQRETLASRLAGATGQS